MRLIFLCFLLSVLTRFGFSQAPSIVFEQAINEFEGGGIPALDNGDWFGYAVAPIGDLNQDGFQDLAVGAVYDDDGGLNRGAVYILFMDASATIDHYQKISQTQGGFTGSLVDESFFGSDFANVGDLDGNGVQDLVVGASGDDDGGSWAGALWVLFLNSDGTVLNQQKISALVGWPNSPLEIWDRFGKGLDSIGDINGDGVIDLMAGVIEDDDGGNNHGAVYVLFLNPDGTVQGHNKISEITPGFGGTLTNGAGLGWAIACLGDLNNDGSTEVLVSSPYDAVIAANDGSVWMMSISSTGDLVSNLEFSRLTSPILASELGNGFRFGSGLARGFNMFCDGHADISIGCMSYGPPTTGAVFLLDLDASYQVQNVQIITEGQANFQEDLNSNDNFGRALHLVTDYDGNGSPDLAVGAMTHGVSGSIWLLSLGTTGVVSVLDDSTQFCTGASVQLYPSVPVSNILWSTGATTDTITVSSPGQIWVSGMQGNCAVNDSAEVISLLQPIVDLGSDTLICNSININVVSNGSDIEWSTGQQLDSIIVAQTGTYYVTVDGVCGLYTDTIFVEVPVPISFSLGSDTTICSGTDLVLQPTGIAGNPDTYLWYNFSSTATDTVSVAGVYWLQLQDQCSSEADTIVIEVALGPSLQMPTDTSLCASQFLLSAIAQTTGTITASWSNGDIGLEAIATTSGVYSLDLNDQCGSVTDSVMVTLFTPVEVELINDTTICNGSQLGLSPITNWQEVIDFQWNGGITDTTLLVSDAGSYWIELNTNCGVVTDTVDVLISSGPIIATLVDTIICGSQFQINIAATHTGPINAIWNTGETTPSITVIESGVYVVQLTDLCGFDSDSVYVGFAQPIELSLAQPAYFCEGDTLNLGATISDPAANVLWSNGQTTEQITIVQSGNYSVTAINACGSAQESVTVVQPTIEPIYASQFQLDCDGGARIGIDSLYTASSLELERTFLWSTGSTSNQIVVHQQGVYSVQVRDYCSVDELFFVVDSTDCLRNNIPNVITPNADNVNDVFNPIGADCGFCPYRLSVFTRWGIKVFEGENSVWDGTLKTGAAAIAGVYYYIVEFETFTDKGFLEVLP